MELETLVKLITENGISICCVLYLMYFNHSTMREMVSALTSINERLAKIENELEKKV